MTFPDFVHGIPPKWWSPSSLSPPRIKKFFWTLFRCHLWSPSWPHSTTREVLRGSEFIAAACWRITLHHGSLTIARVLQGPPCVLVFVPSIQSTYLTGSHQLFAEWKEGGKDNIFGADTVRQFLDEEAKAQHISRRRALAGSETTESS